jgi:hypothetical protein
MSLILAAFYRRGENGRGGCGSQRGEAVDESFEVTDGDNVGLNDEGLGAGDAVAAADLCELLDGGDGAADLQVAAGDGEAHEHADGYAKHGHVERRVIAGDDAGFLQAMDALCDGGRGEADLAAEFGEGEAGVLLEGFKNLPGDGVEIDGVGSGSVRHEPAILKLLPHYA